MTLGEKIKSARIERHMTQKDVVGDYITRNMLSKIENGSATPSVKTLEYLADALGLPAGYFMSEGSGDERTGQRPPAFPGRGVRRLYSGPGGHGSGRRLPG